MTLFRIQPSEGQPLVPLATRKDKLVSLWAMFAMGAAAGAILGVLAARALA